MNNTYVTRSLQLLICVAACAGVLALQGCAMLMPGNAVPTAPSPSRMATSGSGAPSASLQISGAVERPLRLDLEALKGLPSVQVTANGRSYTGASVWALLRQAGINGVSANPAATGGLFLVATGSDGFKAVLSLGEIDPSYGNRQAIVAYAVDGTGLGPNGFARLIVGGDAKMSRAVSRLASIVVQSPQ